VCLPLEGIHLFFYQRCRNGVHGKADESSVDCVNQ